MGCGLRIAIVSTGIVPGPPRAGGGIEAVVYELAARLREKGCEVLVVDREPGPRSYRGVVVERIRVPGVHRLVRHSMSRRIAVAMNAAASLWFGAAAAGVLAGIEADIVHFNHPPASVALLGMDGRGTVYTVHNAIYLGALTRLALATENGLELVLVRKAGAAATTHHSLRIALERLAGRSDIEVVYNGVDTILYSPGRARELARLPPDIKGFIEGYENIVVYAGPVIPEKGPDLLVAAAAEAARLDPSVSRETGFIVAGPGGGYGAGGETPYYRWLRKLVEKHGLGDRFLFTGELDREKLAVILARASAVAQPFRIYEALSMVALEALASGTPIVVPCSGDAGLLVRWAGIGACYTRGSGVRGVAEALLRVLGDGGMGRRARRLAVELFSWERVAENYLRLYRRAAG